MSYQYIRLSDGTEVPLSGDEMRTIWFSLREYNDKLQKDLSTKYDNDPKFGHEDEMFLGETIAKVSKVLFELEQGGFNKLYSV